MCDFLVAYWHKIATIIRECAPIVMAVIAWLAWRLQGQLYRLTGALESHSTLQIRLLAEKENKPVLWWDPTVEGGRSKVIISNDSMGSSQPAPPSTDTK